MARTRAVALLGVDGALVEIEADMGAGLPAFVIIGLPDTSLGEARDRVRSAATNSGCALPARKLTVNLSPASLPKQGSSFDLGIAIAALAAAEVVPAESVERVVHLGELGLDGRLRPVDGVLPAVLGACRAGPAPSWCRLTALTRQRFSPASTWWPQRASARTYEARHYLKVKPRFSRRRLSP